MIAIIEKVGTTVWAKNARKMPWGYEVIEVPRGNYDGHLYRKEQRIEVNPVLLCSNLCLVRTTYVHLLQKPSSPEFCRYTTSHNVTSIMTKTKATTSKMTPNLMS